MFDFERETVSENSLISDKLKLQNTLKKLEQEMKKLHTEKFHAYEQYKDGFLTKEQYVKIKTDFDTLYKKYERNENDLQNDLNNFTASTDQDLTTAIKKFTPFETLTPEIADTFIKRICICSDGSIKIEWAFENLFLQP